MIQLNTPFDAGLIIRDRRKALKLGQQALADRVGVSRKWLVGLENGRLRTDLGLVLRTLSALGLTLYVSGSSDKPKTMPKSSIDPRALDVDFVIQRAMGKPR